MPKSRGGKIIITGGAGFIGSHLAEAYLKQEWRVVVIDNLVSGRKKNLPGGVTFYQADIRDPRRLAQIFQREHPQVVSHHAALINVAEYMTRPAEMLETNLQGTINVLSAFARFGTDKKLFIFPSSAAVYGTPARLPIQEDSPLKPESPYGLSKSLAEDAIRFYGKIYGLPYQILRYANVYGSRRPRSPAGGVIAYFAHLLKSGQTPVIYGDGKKTREYIHVGDVVRANLLAHTAPKNGTYNIGTGRATTDLQILEGLAQVLNVRPRVRFSRPRAGEVRHMVFKVSHAKHDLKFKAQIKLTEGLRQTTHKS